MSLFSAFLYGVGVYQSFMDPTQLMLLRISVLSGLVLGILSLYNVIMAVWFLLRGRGLRHFAGIALHLLAGCFGVLTAVAAIFIILLAGGT
jgi:hypothetical protein